MLVGTLVTPLRSAGLLNVTKSTRNELKMTCPFHETQYPDGTHSTTAYIIGKREQFFCFSCKASMKLGYFLWKVGADGPGYEEIKREQRRIYVDSRGYEKMEFKQEPDGQFLRGLDLLMDSGDFRLYPKAVKYVERRLGKGFKLPPNLDIRLHEDRNTLLFKAVHDMVFEKFPPGSNKVALNHGDASLFLFNKEKVQFLVVVEGLFDALRVYQLGYDVAALMTDNLSERTLDQLEQAVKGKVLLFLDNDDAGRSMVESASDKIRSRGLALSVVDMNMYSRLHWGKAYGLKDPGEMPYEELRSGIEFFRGHNRVKVSLSPEDRMVG